jgi:hypothetical protein
MNPNQIGTYLLIVGAIIAIAVIVYKIHNWNLTKKFGAGWQFYFAPTTQEPPGTVFRIDANRTRYIVEILKVKFHTGKEVFPDYKGSLTASLGILASFLNVKGVDLKAQSSKTEELVFKMKEPKREYLDDQDLDSVLDLFIKGLTYRVDNRYFVIRECRKAKGLTYKVTRDQLDNLGGEASLNELVKLKGKLIKSRQKDEFVIESEFNQPMRVMYLPEEIKPISSGLAGTKPELGRVPVSEPLVWEAEGESEVKRA